MCSRALKSTSHLRLFCSLTHYCSLDLLFDFDSQEKYQALPDTEKLPLSLVDDLVKLVQLAHVGQVELYDSIRSCCGLTGATSSGPLDDFVQRVSERVRVRERDEMCVREMSAMREIHGRKHT